MVKVNSTSLQNVFGGRPKEFLHYLELQYIFSPDTEVCRKNCLWYIICKTFNFVTEHSWHELGYNYPRQLRRSVEGKKMQEDGVRYHSTAGKTDPPFFLFFIFIFILRFYENIIGPNENLQNVLSENGDRGGSLEKR
jgi:hypothetical protein